MIETQIRARGVSAPRIIAAMRAVPRELFVSPSIQSRAYDDAALPSDCGQTLSQPYIVAKMTELLDPRPSDRVLEVGTGTGYQTAILALLTHRVHTVEWYTKLAIDASERLERLGIRNVEYRCADGSLGWPQRAPFERILVTAGAPCVPAALRPQLAEGGILVVPTGGPDTQSLTIVHRRGDRFEDESVLPVRFVRLQGDQGWRD